MKPVKIHTVKVSTSYEVDTFFVGSRHSDAAIRHLILIKKSNFVM